MAVRHLIAGAFSRLSKSENAGLQVFRCSGVQDHAGWREALARFGADADVYFQPEYLAAYEANGDGKAEAILASAGEAHLLVPYLRCPIDSAEGGLVDVQGAYGYGGPLTKCASSAFTAAAWQRIETCWRESGVVAAFLRLHPLYENTDGLGSGWEIVDERQSVSIDLREGLAAAFAGAVAANHRNMVSRALGKGLSVRQEPMTAAGLRAFVSQYRQNMVRLGADDYYLFSDGYFESLACGLGDALALFGVYAPDIREPIAMALIMWGPRWAHYHLSARAASADNCAVNLLLQAVAEAAAERELEGVHLGGGRSSAEDDTLLRFKQRIGQSCHRFRTARKVINPARYADLIGEWQRAHGGKTPDWFLGYRQK